MKRAGILLSLILIITAAEAFSQVTIRYEGVVSYAFGLHGDLIPAGERVVVTYTLDPSEPDVNSDPNRGDYANAVLSMSVDFPDLGIFAHAVPPTGELANLGNDMVCGAALCDSLQFRSGPVTSSRSLGGDPISFIVLEYDTVPPAAASMLSSDILPLYILPASHAYIMMTSGGAITQVRFTYTSPITISYDAVVTYASGPHSALFPAGERISVTYTLDQVATDSNSDPSRGLFHNAVENLSISFPGLSIAAEAGSAGLAQTFDNIASSMGVLSDQVFFHGGPLISASSLGGEPITRIEVDFLSRFVSSPSEPTMLSSDALPISRLPLTDSFVLLYTASGPTFVNFAPPPRERLVLLIDEVQALADTGALTASQAEGLIRRLEDAIDRLDRGRDACNKLQSFINKVNDLVATGGLSADQGQNLIETALSIQDQLGC